MKIDLHDNFNRAVSRSYRDRGQRQKNMQISLNFRENSQILVTSFIAPAEKPEEIFIDGGQALLEYFCAGALNILPCIDSYIEDGFNFLRRK